MRGGRGDTPIARGVKAAKDADDFSLLLFYAHNCSSFQLVSYKLA